MKNQCNFISNYANYDFLTSAESHFSGCSLFHPSRHIILDLCMAPAGQLIDIRHRLFQFPECSSKDVTIISIQNVPCHEMWRLK